MADLSRPQGYHPDLTDERLSVLGELVATQHNSAVRDERREAGDRPWSTGCRSYDRVKSGVEDRAKALPWLTFDSEGSLAFFFRVGECPMRIRKPDQHLAVRAREAKVLNAMSEQLTLDAPGLGIPLGAALRVEKVIEGRLVRVVYLALVGPNDETVYRSWRIYEAKDDGGQLLAPSNPPPPHDPGRASVSPKRSADSSESDASGSQ